MIRRWIVTLCLFGVLASAGAAHADQVYIGNLDTAETGGIHAPISAKVALSSEKPKGITKEPIYRYKPLYGVLKMGDAKENEIFVVLDSGDNVPRPSLFVDVNANGDLTDDPPIKLTLPEGEKDRLVGTVSVTARYNIAGRGGKVSSAITFSVYGKDLNVNREYGRAGTLPIGGKTYKIALIDTGINSRFDDYKHEKEDEEPKVLLLVDRNNDGKFDILHEAYDLGKPFRVGGQTLNTVNVDPRGMKVTLRGTGTKARPKVKAEELQEDGDVIEFETATTTGEIISFPDDYAGKFVLLHFWSMADQNSLVDLAALKEVYRRAHSRGFEIISVSLDTMNQGQALKDFLKLNEIKWDQIYDNKATESRIAKSYGIKTTPYSILVDGETGKIIAMGTATAGINLQRTLLAAVMKKIQSFQKKP